MILKERETMKERINGTGERYEFGFETKIEYEVGDILLDLQEIIIKSQSRNQFSLVWGARGRRSAKDSSAPSPPRQEEREIDKRLQVNTQATSPSTPLCFSPSECDEKSKHQLPKTSSKKRYSKRPTLHTRKDWLEIIDGLTQRNELLTKEVDAVRGYYKKLMTFNLALKAKKDEINCYLRKKNPQMEINRGLRMDQQQQYPPSVFPHQQPSCSSSSFKVEYYPNGGILSSSSGSGLGMVNPRGIPDLNVVCTAEETFGMRKIMAAQARKRRMITMDNKKKKII